MATSLEIPTGSGPVSNQGTDPTHPSDVNLALPSDGNTRKLSTAISRRALASAQTVGLRKSKISKYGVAFAPPPDDAVHYASADSQTSFFEKVRGLLGKPDK